MDSQKRSAYRQKRKWEYFTKYGQKSRPPRVMWRKLHGVQTSWPYSWLGYLMHAAHRNYHQHGSELESITVRRHEDGWKAVITVQWRGKKYVAFETAASLREIFYLVGEGLRDRRLKFYMSKFS